MTLYFYNEELASLFLFSSLSGRSDENVGAVNAVGRSLVDHEYERMELIKGAEDYLAKMAFGSYFNGHKCMLRALCEAAAVS